MNLQSSEIATAPAPRLAEQIVSGTLERGARTLFSVGGTDFIIDENTWVFGSLRIGSQVSVDIILKGNSPYAKKIAAR